MKGKRLNLGDTIGFVAPASPEEAQTIEKAIQFFKDLGYCTVSGKHLYDKYGFLAGKDKDRAEDLMAMFKDSSIDIILCMRGGYGAMRLLPYLKPDIVKKNPKIFAGFSDITVLLNYFFQKCNLITFHSPMGSSNFNDEETFKSFFRLLTQDSDKFIIQNPKDVPFQTINPGIAEGQLVGGNLSLISATMGTPYEINTSNKVLFIEDVGEEPYRIDRSLTQLLISGKLNEAKGIILGQFTNCELPNYDKSLTLEQIFEDRIYNLKKPVLKDFASGHSYPRLTLPIGAKVQLNSTLGTIEVLESVVKK